MVQSRTSAAPAAAAPDGTAHPAQPLAGLRVLDVSQVMAGPFCCMMLGDQGADVIKIEPPNGGDQTRRAMGFKLRGDDSLGFLNMNRNKRSVVIDLKTEAGREAFFALVRTADIIVENYRPGVMKKLGVDYAAIRAINPAIIYASISGFGQTGPWADRPGFDLIAQAASGVMSITGQPDGPPAKSGVPVTDIGCALFTLYAILSAVIGRQTSGQGQYIDASLFEAGLAFSIWDICDFWGTGQVPQRIGTANRMAAPYQAVRADDGSFVFGANNDRLWARLCKAIGREDLTEQPAYATNAGRMAHREPLIAALEATFATASRAHWVDLLLEHGIPAGPINDYAEALDNPHAEARGAAMTLPHPVEGEYLSIGFPVKLSGTPPTFRRPPPLLGEHTEEVMAELGLPQPDGPGA